MDGSQHEHVPHGYYLNVGDAESWVPRLYRAFPAPAPDGFGVTAYAYEQAAADATNIRAVAAAFGGIDDECRALDEMVRHCASPIEKLMLGAFAVLDAASSQFHIYRFQRPFLRALEGHDDCYGQDECVLCRRNREQHEAWQCRFPVKDDAPLVLLQTQSHVYGTRRRVDFKLTLQPREPRALDIGDLLASTFGAARVEDEFTLAVEVDGHDFHERTKQQARRDKQRDRQLLAAGLQTVRFTGSEVWEDCRRCAQESIDLLLAMRSRADLVAV